MELDDPLDHHDAGEPQPQIVAAAGLGAVTVVVLLHESARVMPGLFDGLRGAGAVIVVDNASSDEGPGLARAAGAQLVRLPENRGRAGALNAAASLATTPYLLFLKPDVTIGAETVAALLKRLDTDRGLFAAAPPLRVGRRLHRRTRNRLGRPEGAASGPSGLSGAALLLRRDTFERLEGFDRRIMLGGVEDDLCRRALARGWRLALVETAPARRAPARARAGGRGWARRAWAKGYQTTAARLYLAKKHGLGPARGREARWAALALLSALTGLSRIEFVRGLAALRAAYDDPPLPQPPTPDGAAEGLR